MWLWPLKAKTSRGQEQLSFWLSICENAAASEVLANFWLPFCICSVKQGTIKAPSDFVLNLVVLLLNLSSSYMEGFTKSTRLLSQTLRKSNSSHMLVFIASNGFSIGFLNVSSSFPDVGEGGRDIGFDQGNMAYGHLFIIVNFVGSILFYRWGRQQGWTCMQRQWTKIVSCCVHWPTFVRIIVVISFVFVVLGPSFYGYDVPLDLGDPQMDPTSFDNVDIRYNQFMIHLPAIPFGLAFGILMSVLGCIAATLLSDVWFEDRHRPAARLVANFVSTVAVLFLEYVQSYRASPSFVLMKFSSSFCGAMSAFTGTIGDVYDECLGVAYEEGSYDDPDEKADRTNPAISGMQNFIAHWIMTTAIMLFGVYTAGQDRPPILQPRVLRSKIDAWGSFAGRQRNSLPIEY